MICLILPENQDQNANQGTRQSGPQKIKTRPMPEHSHHTGYQKIGECHAQENTSYHSLVYFSVIKLIRRGKYSNADQRCQQPYAQYALYFFHPVNF